MASDQGGARPVAVEEWLNTRPSWLRPDEIPAEHLEEWGQILGALTHRGPELGASGEVLKGALDHTLDRMRNSSGRKIAERIYARARQID